MSNGTGYGSGKYAHPDQVKVYAERMTAYLAGRNAMWLDKWTDPKTGEIPKGIKELANEWKADGHLAKWAKANGLLDPSTVPEDGIKHRQIGRLTAIVYTRSEEHRGLITRELARYLDKQEADQTSAFLRETDLGEIGAFLDRVGATMVEG